MCVCEEWKNISLLFVRYFDKATNKGRWGPQGIEQQKIWKREFVSYIFSLILFLLGLIFNSSSFFFSLAFCLTKLCSIVLYNSLRWILGEVTARPDFIFFKWILLVNFNFPQVGVGCCQLHSHSFIKTSNFTFHNLEETQAWHRLNYNPKRNLKLSP